MAHFDTQRPVIVETDASDFALVAVLSQKDNKGRLHPVAFHSRKFQASEINYEIHDKELLAVVDAFKHWRQYCEGALHQIQVFLDHHNLEYFTTTKVLNRRQARWAEELAGINFRIYYRPGSQTGRPNALSRRLEYRPEKGGIENQPITTVLRENHFGKHLASSFICSAAGLTSLPMRKWDKEFLSKVREEGKKDEEYQQTWTQIEKEVVLADPVPKDRKVTEGRLSVQEGLVYRRNILCIPKGLVRQIIESEHDTKVAGHMGQDKTIELI